MNKPPRNAETTSPAALRQRAEAVFQEKAAQFPEPTKAMSPEATRHMLHELRVHQIQLEMQNEELRRTHVELDASRARYFDLYDLAPVGYCTLSEQGLIQEANLTAATLLGVARGALVNNPISRFILKEDQDIYYRHRKQLFETGEPQACDLRMGKPDGTTFWAHLAATALQDETGKPGCRIVLSDITGRKKVEEALQESEQMLQNVLENFPGVVFWKDRQSNYLGCNQSFALAAGITCPTDIIRKNDFDLPWGATEAERYRADDGEVMESGKAKLHIVEMQHQIHGRVTWFDTSKIPLRNSEGQVIGVLGVSTDITGRKQTQEALRQSEEKFRTLFENASDAILLLHEDRFVDCNGRTLEIFGCQSRDQIAGHSPYELSPVRQPNGRDSREFALEKITAALAGQPQFFEWMHTKFDGTPLPVEVSLNTMELGDKVFLQAIVRDITARKQSEKELQEKNAEMERFTSTVSHDLKSPLVTIKTFLGYLEQDVRAQKAEQIEKDLAYIHSAADKMSRLLDELLELARVGHKRNPPVAAPLQEIVQEALDLVAGQIAQRGVQVDVTQEPIWLHGDRARLVEVFENLVDNAVKFLGDQPSPRVEIGVEPGDGEPVLFVRDNGKGIDPRHQSKLFGLFEQLDANQPGSGMGLAMVRRIVELHGGKIWLQSDGLGHGTTFRFTLAKTQIQQEPS